MSPGACKPLLRLAWAGLLLAFWCAPPALAQEPDRRGRSRLRETEERGAAVAALDRYVEPLFARNAPPTPAALIEYSRLLPEPQQQIEFLLKWVKHQVAAENLPYARELRELAVQRLDLWQRRGVAFTAEPPLNQQLAEAVPVPTLRLPEILEAQALAQALAAPDPEQVGGLSDAEKFRLLARGVPAEVLNLRRPPVWAIPFDVMGSLARGDAGELPTLPELLALRERLQQSLARAGQVGWDAAATQQLQMAHYIALAWIERALGASAAAAAPPEGAGESWLAVSNELAAQDAQRALWYWSAAARLLAAAAASEATARGTAGAAAEALLAQLRVVAGVGGSQAPGHLRSLEHWGGRLDAPPQSPALARQMAMGDYFAPLRSAGTDRAAAVAALVTLWPRVSNQDMRAIDEALGWMQRAKARQIGLPDEAVNIASIEDVQAALPGVAGRGVPGVNLYLEVLAAAPDAWYGLALLSTRGTFNVGDTWRVVPVGPAASYQALLQDTVQGQRWSGAKLIVSPDLWAWQPAGRQAEAAELMSLVSETTRSGDSWLVHVPSAGALLAAARPGQGWSPERALRLCYVDAGGARLVERLDLLRSGSEARAYAAPLPIGDEQADLLVVAPGESLATTSIQRVIGAVEARNSAMTMRKRAQPPWPLLLVVSE